MSMTFAVAMAELKKMGTAQNVKVYKRHGAGDNLFGVSFANLYKLQKKIGVNHPLAIELWKSGNSDARTLATMVADPAQLTPSLADQWLADIRYYGLADLLSGLVAKSPIAAQKRKEWMESPEEFARQVGYDLFGYALKNGDGIPDADCRRILKTIEAQIRRSANRARHAMNSALIAIGIYRPALRAEAIAAARRIGKVEVDHRETSCKTPDAVSYIQKALARKKK